MGAYQPETPEQLRDAVASAVADKVSLEVMGAGTKRSFGRPVTTAHVLDTSALSGVRLYEPAELVLTAGAATPLADIQALLAAQGQHLAFEPADYGRLLGGTGRQTLGGVIATNMAGPRRISAGAARDHLLGFSAVSGRGEVFKSGGQVVKNVTGYDLSKLMAGSWGTLAVLTEVTVKVLPRPETETTLLVSGLDPATAVTLMARAMGSPHEVSAAAWLPVGTALRLEGPAPSVAFRARALADGLGRPDAVRLDGDASADFWQAVRDVTRLAETPMEIVWRVSVPPSAGPAVLSALPGATGFMDWGGGLVWLALPTATGDCGAGCLRAAVAPHGGHATLVRAPAIVRGAIPVFEPQPAGLAALTRRVKASFDPLAVLNPGRMYPDI